MGTLRRWTLKVDWDVANNTGQRLFYVRKYRLRGPGYGDKPPLAFTLHFYKLTCWLTLFGKAGG